MTFSAPFGTFDLPPGTDSTGNVVAHYTLVGDNGAHSGAVTITALVAPVPAVPGDTVMTSLTLQINPAAAPVLSLSANSALLNSTAGAAALAHRHYSGHERRNRSDFRPLDRADRVRLWSAVRLASGSTGIQRDWRNY